MSITNAIQINTNAVGVQQGDLNSIQISSFLEHSQDDLKSPQLVGELEEAKKGQQVVAQIFQIPWVIIEKSLPSSKTHDKALFYVNQT